MTHFKKSLRLCLAIAGMCSALTASAHEFWMWPSAFSSPVGSSVALSLNVGEYFSGERIGFVANQAALLRHSDARLTEDITGSIPNIAVAELRLKLARPGTHLFAYDSQPSTITLQADKFHAYLHDEGLDDIIELRKASGEADMPGRERYRRNVKTLVRAGGKTDAVHATRSGQRLEIIPARDASNRPVGSTLEFSLEFDGKPLANRLIKAWHKHGGQTVVIRVRSNEDGRFALALPYAGAWMLSVVHMVRANDAPEVDWDSFWGNLSFEMAAGKK
ncbi:DUF4198 domain-containing protein [soil metagenome]